MSLKPAQTLSDKFEKTRQAAASLSAYISFNYSRVLSVAAKMFFFFTFTGLMPSFPTYRV